MSARLTENDTEVFIDGDNYTSVLSDVHAKVQPKSYLEVGTLHGATLRLSRCKTVAVDPAFQLDAAVEIDPARITLREMTSDDYFANHDPKKDLNGEIEFAFLDGMHEFPYLLRDFINTEKACGAKSIVAMHDCIPLDCHMTRMHRDVEVEKPTNHPGYWAGDVWKMIPVLRKYRPDLDVRCLDAVPTGLTIVRGLDPKNTVLRDRYDEILREWEHVVLDDYGMAELFKVARIESAAAWRAQLTPLLPVNTLRRLGAIVQPRRRLLKVMSAIGLAAR
jgi:hypothetical protein